MRSANGMLNVFKAVTKRVVLRTRKGKVPGDPAQETDERKGRVDGPGLEVAFVRALTSIHAWMDHTLRGVRYPGNGGAFHHQG